MVAWVLILDRLPAFPVLASVSAGSTGCFEREVRVATNYSLSRIGFVSDLDHGCVDS